MTEDDAEAALALTCDTFEDLSRRLNDEPESRPDPAIATIRFRHLVRTDPDGAWVAEDEHGLAGCALALLREGVWGLSLLVVRPGLQSAGVGSALLRHAHDYADGARGRIILSSPDPRALRAYARLGLALHPTMWAVRDAARRARARRHPRGHARRHPVHRGGRPPRARRRARPRHRRPAGHGPDAADRARPRLRGHGRRRAADARGLRRRRRRATSCGAVLARVDGTATVGVADCRPAVGGRGLRRGPARAAHGAARSSWAATSGRSRPTCRAGRSFL